jgi:hypothetical protein
MKVTVFSANSQYVLKILQIAQNFMIELILDLTLWGPFILTYDAVTCPVHFVYILVEHWTGT